MKQYTKSIIIDGKEVQLVLRHCQCERCTSFFFVLPDSLQTICSVKCWEITYEKRWDKNSMPGLNIYTRKNQLGKTVKSMPVIFPVNQKLFNKNKQKAKELKAKIAAKLI